MQTVITDVSYDRTLLLMRSEYEKLSENGCFFAIVRTEYDQKGNVLHDLMDVVSSAVEIGYVYVNTIVYPTALPQRAAFTDNVKYVVWLCKNRSAMKFNKDAIREKHTAWLISPSISCLEMRALYSGFWICPAAEMTALSFVRSVS